MMNRNRNRSFRSGEVKLIDTANRLATECHAEVAVVADNPTDDRVVRHGIPNLDQVLRTFGYETKIPDLLQRFGATLNEVSASIQVMNPDEFSEFKQMVAALTNQVQETRNNFHQH